MAESNNVALSCPKCKAVVSPGIFNSADRTICPKCWGFLKVTAFPALYRPLEKGRQGDAILVDTDASCYNHPSKKATEACEACGRFLCDLCHIELHDKHLCPSCVQTGKKKGKLKNINRRLILYDDLALILSLAPLIIYPLTIIAAPATIFVVLRYWKKPSGIIPRSKAKFVIAFIIALVEIMAWTAFMIMVVYG